MIRSSRIPPLLTKICTNGIVSSLLITSDGVLLGCSSLAVPAPKYSNGKDGPSVDTDIHVNVNANEKNEKVHDIGAVCNGEINTWLTMNPSDIGALVAEVVDDYRRLGSELAVLHPSSSSTRSGMAGGVSLSPRSTGFSGSSKDSMIVDKEDSGSSGTGGEGNIKRNANSSKERGRLHCLIIELDAGLVGIASATSGTYVVALAESTAHQGMLKGRLTALADHVRDSFSQLND